jgi:colanic acid biosynthesis glycosyl transferase WcaI
MASGLSVIATTGGGAEHMVEPAGGLLVPPSRADAIADALLRIGTIPRELVRRGERARRFAEQRFGTKQYVEQLVRMYQSLAEGV